jgi:hypothetical protein
MPLELDLDQVRRTLHEDGLLPEGVLTVFIGGSAARGWEHARSDADVYVVATAPWQGESNGFNSVGLDPSAVPTNVTYVDGRRWELRYWLDDQVDQLLAKVAWDQFEHVDSTAELLNIYESGLLGRIDTALIVEGGDWVRKRREQIGTSAFRSMLTLKLLAATDRCAEDACGMLEAGELHSAVGSAQMALGRAADAVTLNAGEYSLEEKWRARRMRTVNPAILPFDRYWELATMRSFDPQRPAEWVQAVVSLCREVSLEVEV